MPERAGRHLAVSRYSPSDPLDIVAAHKARLAETGVSILPGRAIGLHAILFVTPEVISRAGDLHDPENPRNVALLEQAIAFCEEVFGEGSVIAARVDLDEGGGGAVDVFVVPIERLAINQHTNRISISVETPLKRLQSLYGADTSFAALQSAWAQHAKEHIDPDVVRGIPKKLTSKLHIFADEFRETVERAQALAKEAYETARLQMRQEVEDERLRLQTEAEADAFRVREAAQVEVAQQKDQAEQKMAASLARLRNAARAAATKAASERETLERDRTVLLAERQRVADASASIEQRVTHRIDAALKGISFGLEAYELGYVVGVPDDAGASGVKFFASRNLGSEQIAALRAELAPAWTAGLENALRIVHMAHDAATGAAKPVTSLGAIRATAA